MRVKHHCVAAGNHANGVAQHCFAGVRTRGHCADDAVGRHLQQHQALIAGNSFRHQILRARGLHGYIAVFQDLVLYTAHAGFRNAQLCHFLRLFHNQTAGNGDKLLTLLKGQVAKLSLRLVSSLNCFVHIVKYAVIGFSVDYHTSGDGCRLGILLITGHVRNNLADYFFNFLVADIQSHHTSYIFFAAFSLKLRAAFCKSPRHNVPGRCPALQSRR